MKRPKSKLERFAYDIVLGFVIGALFIAIALFLTGCPKRKDGPLRQWYPIDRCHDYARALPVYGECMGCAGSKCEVVVNPTFGAPKVYSLDCSGRVCLSR